MKYCPDCKVYVSGARTNCPLCGKYVKDAEVIAPGAPEDYKENSEQYIKYYPLRIVDGTRKEFLKRRSFALLCVIVALCFLVNLLTRPKPLWALFPLIWGVVIHRTVLTTIYKKRRLYVELVLLAVYLTLASCLTELVIRNFAGKAANIELSVRYILPGVLFCLMAASDAMFLISSKRYAYYYLSGLCIGIISLLPYLIGLIFEKGWLTWCNLVLFLFAIGSMALVGVIKWRTAKGELRKKFFLK